MFVKASVRIDQIQGQSVPKSDGTETLSYYTQPPNEEISLDEFELFALNRLQLLRGFESIKAKGYEPREAEPFFRMVSIFIN